jgi:hypothetical protein
VTTSGTPWYAVHAPAQLADGLAAAQQRLHREAAHRQDEARAQQLDLAHQEGLAARHLGGLGVAVARRAALQRVGDVDLARRLGRLAVLGARQAEGAQHVVQQLAGGADEGLALPVLLLARGFADDHPLRLRVAAPNTVCRRLSHRRRRAAGHGRAQRGPVQRGDVAGAFFEVDVGGGGSAKPLRARNVVTATAAGRWTGARRLPRESANRCGHAGGLRPRFRRASALAAPSALSAPRARNRPRARRTPARHGRRRLAPQPSPAGGDHSRSPMPRSSACWRSVQGIAGAARMCRLMSTACSRWPCAAG